MDRLRAAHPTVEIESCSSGGGRADYEILERTDRIWTSDCNDPIERQAIQRGFSIFFPPEVMGSHVGAAASHTTARTASLDLRAMTALGGHMGIEADLRAFTPEERAQLAAAIALHKTLRADLHAGRTLRLEHPDCLAFANVGAASVLVSAAQVETSKAAALAPLRVVGLEPEADYEITMLNPPERPFAVMKRRIPLVKGDTPGRQRRDAGRDGRPPAGDAGRRDRGLSSDADRAVNPATLAADFRARFGGQPRLFRAPGRINIIGEHTDYSEGFVLPAAIDRWCLVAAAPNGLGRLRAVSPDPRRGDGGRSHGLGPARVTGPTMWPDPPRPCWRRAWPSWAPTC